MSISRSITTRRLSVVRQLTDVQTSRSAPQLIADLYPMAATYSLRQVKTGATQCVRVRRSSDSTESDIGFSGGGLDTAALLSFCGAGDGFVTKWYDQSGNGRDVAQATTTAQPKIVSSGAVVTDASLPAMQFDSDDSLLTAAAFPGMSGDLTASVFTVSRKTTNGGGCLWGVGDVGVALAAFGLYDDGSSAVIAFSGGNSYVLTAITNDTRYLHSFIKTPGAINTTTSVFRNGVDCASTGHSTATPNVTASALSIGAWANYPANLFIGKVQEFFVFTTDQTANRTTLRNLINDYWGVYGVGAMAIGSSFFVG